jgi:hypothetical protein
VQSYRDDILSDYEVCQILIDDAINDLYRNKFDEALYAPWGNIFKSKMNRSNG